MRKAIYKNLNGFAADLFVLAALVIAVLGAWRLLHWIYNLVLGFIYLALCTAGVLLIASLFVYFATKLVLDINKSKTEITRTEGK